MTKPHEPTDILRGKVIGFSCAGFTQAQIADYLEIDDNTLRKHYRYELDHAKMDKTAALANSLYRDALEGDKDDRQFWLKCQAKWSYAKPEEDKKTVTDTLLEKLIDKL
jgi:plasmid maintenance system antidote protein VapI